MNIARSMEHVAGRMESEGETMTLRIGTSEHGGTVYTKARRLQNCLIVEQRE